MEIFGGRHFYFLKDKLSLEQRARLTIVLGDFHG
jgi:hypothetical protein